MKKEQRQPEIHEAIEEIPKPKLKIDGFTTISGKLEIIGDIQILLVGLGFKSVRPEDIMKVIDENNEAKEKRMHDATIPPWKKPTNPSE